MTYRYEDDIEEPIKARDAFWTGTSLANGPVQRSFAMGPSRDTDVLSWLVHLVDAYSRRNLRFDSDTLRAFSAVLRDFDGRAWYPFNDDDEMRDPDETEESWCIGIVQGLPFHYKPDEEGVMGWELMSAKLNTSGLCWHHGIEGNARREGFPSWSWAGWHGPVEWVLPYADVGEVTAFQLEVAGFRAGLAEDDEVMDLDEARKAQPEPPVLRIASIAIPAEAFVAEDRDGHGGAEHMGETIYMYGRAMPWSAEECVANLDAMHTHRTYPRGFLCHAEGARQVSRQALREGLQNGMLKLLLVHIYVFQETLSLQAWILRKVGDIAGAPHYERIGGITHVTVDGNKEDARLYECLEGLVKRDSELEMFDVR